MRHNNPRQSRFDEYWDDIAGDANRRSYDDSINAFGDFADEAHGSPFNGEPVVHEEELDTHTVTVDEAFGGVGATSDRVDESRDYPIQTSRPFYADTTPAEDEARIADIATRDALDRREERDRQRFGQFSRPKPVTFERQVPTGRMAPEDVEPDASVPVDRDPNTGRFVSSDRTDAGIKRDPLDGIFRPVRY